MNEVRLMGQIVSDVEVRFSAKGKPWMKFKLETKNGKFSSKHSVKAFGDVAETAGELRKGVTVKVIGSLQYSTQDQPDGTKKYYTDVVAEVVELPKIRLDAADAPL